jgi:hypothetical protein
MHIRTWKYPPFTAVHIWNQVGTVVAVIVWWLDLPLPVQSVPIITDIVRSNLDLGEVYNIMW